MDRRARTRTAGYISPLLRLPGRPQRKPTPSGRIRKTKLTEVRGGALEERLRDAVVRVNDGEWFCRAPVDFVWNHGPSLQLTPSVTYRSGVRYDGVDVAAMLDDWLATGRLPLHVTTRFPEREKGAAGRNRPAALGVRVADKRVPWRGLWPCTE
jgi:hypothetical protein